LVEQNRRFAVRFKSLTHQNAFPQHFIVGCDRISQSQQSLFPTSPRDWLNADHLVYFLLDVVGQMDLSPFLERYKISPCGQPPYHPRMMLTLLLYAYCTGVFSSRKIYKRCQEDVAVRVIVGEDIPGIFARVLDTHAYATYR